MLESWYSKLGALVEVSHSALGSGRLRLQLRLLHLAANPQPFSCISLSHIRVVSRDS